MRAYSVVYSIVYLDGPLAGQILTDQQIPFSTREAAEREARHLDQVKQAGDFVRAILTGNRYQIDGVFGVVEAES